MHQLRSLAIDGERHQRKKREAAGLLPPHIRQTSQQMQACKSPKRYRTTCIEEASALLISSFAMKATSVRFLAFSFFMILRT